MDTGWQEGEVESIETYSGGEEFACCLSIMVAQFFMLSLIFLLIENDQGKVWIESIKSQGQKAKPF